MKTPALLVDRALWCVRYPVPHPWLLVLLVWSLKGDVFAVVCNSHHAISGGKKEEKKTPLHKNATGTAEQKQLRTRI